MEVDVQHRPMVGGCLQPDALKDWSKLVKFVGSAFVAEK
jgi:hypothetical protein